MLPPNILTGFIPYKHVDINNPVEPARAQNGNQYFNYTILFYSRNTAGPAPCAGFVIEK